MLRELRTQQKRKGWTHCSRQLQKKLLRFHVLANSDAKDDQNVKLKVRDAVGHMLGQKLKKVTDRAQTEKIVQDHMDEIIETAEKTLRKSGYTYGASARLANVDFPVKRMGIIRFRQVNTVHCRLHWEKEKDITGGVCCIRTCVFRDRYMRLWMNLPTRSCVKFLTQEEYADVFDSGKCRSGGNSLIIFAKLVMIMGRTNVR